MTADVPRTIAVVYGTNSGGGMGDVGKYAVSHALSAPGVTVKPIAMTSRATAEPSFDLDVDVKPDSLRQEIMEALKDVQAAELVVEDEDTPAQLEAQFEGVDAVIACVGSRQSGGVWQWLTGGEKALNSRWCESGARLVADAMAAKGVKRLVLLSAFGIGDDFLPLGLMKMIWGFLINTTMREAKADMTAMEKAIEGTELDYLLVKAVALTAEKQPTGAWRFLTKRGEKPPLSFYFSAKSDLALYMLG